MKIFKEWLRLSLILIILTLGWWLLTGDDLAGQQLTSWEGLL